MKTDQFDGIFWFGMYLGCVKTLPKRELAKFEKWDKERTGDLGSSDWPGFEKYIGKRLEFNRKPAFKKKPISYAMRMKIFERDGFTCKRYGSQKQLTIDQIVAESKGGANTDDNYQTLCCPCNCRKGVQ